MRSATRPALTDISGGGFFIRKVASPGAVLVKGAVQPLARQARTPSSNKENVPPVGALAAPKRRSLLPDWYPRTPLRDITSIVKLARRSRLRLSNKDKENVPPAGSIQSVDPRTPVQVEQNDPRSTLQAQDTLGAVTSGLGSTSSVANLATSVSEGASSSPSDSSSQTVPFKPNDSALADLMEKKLSSSIEQIEKIVSRRLKETPKAAQPSKVAVQRRTLMSMR
ncbi:hypothetical protein HU200_062407 [Digitaria exilis]|uniref:Uncharacterized protein n=1 Tax=Digitaria exilis TaxID=1010633 RepID=A0A835AA56_9POAL|nr:hypothetical protein HU200_062407 [Digitaria exilis]